MLFAHVDPARIEREWPVIAEILAPAVRQDPKQTLEGLLSRLMTGPDVMMEISGGGRCMIVFEITEDHVCWVKYLAGHLIGGPKQRTATLRAGMQRIEAVAHGAGCIEQRLCGRDWSSIFPDYEPFDGYPNGLRKVLSHGRR